MKLVCPTETQLLEFGSAITTLAQEPHQALQKATHLSASKRERIARELSAAQEAHQHISHRLRRLTQRKKLHLCKIINAYDPTIAPICKGKSNCPTQLQTGPSMQGLWTPVCRVLRGLSHL